MTELMGMPIVTNQHMPYGRMRRCTLDSRGDAWVRTVDLADDAVVEIGGTLYMHPASLRELQRRVPLMQGDR